MGRHVARAIRCAMLSELAAKHWDYLVTNISSGDTAVYNAPKFPDGEVEGVGTHEAPRGTLSHWVVVRNGSWLTTRLWYLRRGTPVHEIIADSLDLMRCH